MGKLSVIVLSKNNSRTIGYCLKSILSAKIPRGYEREIIVVDARSTDGTQRILDKFKGKIKVVYDEGRGIGIARNIGIKHSSGDIICFVDADAIVGRDHFINIVKRMHDADIIDVRSGFKDVEQYIYSKPAELEIEVRRHGRAYSKRMLKNRAFAGGSFISFKRNVIRRVHGFWHYPPFGADDLDFSYRAYISGYKIDVVTVDDSISIPRHSLPELFKQQYSWGRGYAYVISKYRNDPRFWKAYKYSNIVYRLFGRFTWLYVILRLLLAPLGAIILAFSTRRTEIIFYWIVRRYTFLLGLLVALKPAMKYYSLS